MLKDNAKTLLQPGKQYTSICCVLPHFKAFLRLSWTETLNSSSSLHYKYFVFNIMMSLKALNVCAKILYIWYETWMCGIWWYNNEWSIVASCSTRWQLYSPQLLEMLLHVLTHGWTGKALIKSWSYAGLCNGSLCKLWKWEWSYELLHFLIACTSIPGEVARCQHYYTGTKMYRKLDRWLHNDVKCSYRSFYVLFNCDL